MLTAFRFPPRRFRAPGLHRACRSESLKLSYTAILAGLPVLCAPAHAQVPAHVSATLNSVKAVSGATQKIITARVGTVLVTGDSVRTGARSAAGVTFGDGTTLRIGELSEVTVRPGRFHDVRLASGSVFGDFKGPGRVSGRYAVAAVRGTKMLMTTVGNANIIANYEDGPGSHLVDVASASTQLFSGVLTAVPGNPNEVQSDALIGSTEEWVGASLKIGGETRTVTAFDPATGTLTLDAPAAGVVERDTPGTGVTHLAAFTSNGRRFLAQNGGLGRINQFILARPATAHIVTLMPGFQSTVHDGGDPTTPTATPPIEFPLGLENSILFFLDPGKDITNHVDGPLGEQTQQQFFQLTHQMQVNDQPHAPGLFTSGTAGGINVGIPGSNGTGNVGVTVPGGSNGPGSVGVTVPGAGGAGSIGITLPGGSSPGGVGVTIPGSSGLGNVNVGLPGSAGAGSVVVNVGSPAAGRQATRAADFRFNNPVYDALAYQSRNSGSALGYANVSAVASDIYMRTGVLFGSQEGRETTLLDEAMLHYRHPGVGNIQAGRFHWFPGPTSSSTLGRLISFYTGDGLLWRAPTPKALTADFAYFARVDPLVPGPVVSVYAARVGTSIQSAHVGVNALMGSAAPGHVGASIDGSAPVIPHVIEAYGEVGRDLFNNKLYTAGVYLPVLFNQYHTDFFVDYSHRDGLGGLMDFTARFPVGANFTGLAVLSKLGAQTWQPGIGVLARF